MKRNIDHLSTREKLLELAAVLEKVKPERFDMRVWGESSQEPTLDHLTCELAREEYYDCKTAACAAGTAAAAFEGLEWITDGKGLWCIRTDAASDLRTRTLYHYSGFCAAACFFGITLEDAHHLFDVGRYRELSGPEIKPPHVIARLHEVAAKY